MTKKRVVRPKEPKLIRVSDGALLPKQVECTHQRTETYDATQPDGSVVRVWRCIDCGLRQVEPKE